MPCRDQFSSLSHVQLFVTPWTEARWASLSITNSKSLLKLMSIKSVIPSNHLILCHPVLLLPSIFPSTRVFINESVLCIRWPKYWSFSCIARSLDNLFKVAQRTSDRVGTGTQPFGPLMLKHYFVLLLRSCGKLFPLGIISVSNCA